MIESFADKTTEQLFHGIASRRSRRLPQGLLATLKRRLDVLNAADSLNDLARIPGNHLHPLMGGLNGYWSIRVNKQWRLIFRWNEGAHDVQLMDYH